MFTLMMQNWFARGLGRRKRFLPYPPVSDSQRRPGGAADGYLQITSIAAPRLPEPACRDEHGHVGNYLAAGVNA